MLPSPARLTFAGGTLILAGVPLSRIEQLLGPSFGQWDSRIDAWRCDAIHYAHVADRLQQVGLDFADDVPDWRTIRWPHVKSHALRPEQQQAVDCWLPTRTGCIVMPTGTGKTEVALSLMQHTATGTLVVAPVRDLMYQWHRRILAGLGYEAGIIGDSVYRVAPVSVTTYDSACIHMDKLGNRFGLIVFDECHHLPGRIRSDAARMSAAPARLGLTATPERSDGKHVDLESLIGPVAYEMPIAQAKGNSLADYDIVRIPVHFSNEEQAHYDRLSEEVRSYMYQRRQEDPHFTWQEMCKSQNASPEARKALGAYYAKKSIEERAAEKLRVLEDLFRLHAGEPCLIFAGSNAMARDVSRRFLIPCLLNHCRKRERLEILEGLQQHRYPAVVANQVLDEGVDLPDVKVAVVIGGSASIRQAKQRLGRVLRKSGNVRAVLYEVVTANTNEERRSQRRRRSDAYAGTRHRRI